MEWLVLINLVTHGKIIRYRYITGRLTLLRRLETSAAARRIQKNFVAKFGGLRQLGIVRLRARNLLTFYNTHAQEPLFAFSNRKMLAFIRETRQINVIPHKFSDFTGQVRLIQSAWKEYLVKDRERWEELVNIWDVFVANFVADLTRKTRLVYGKGKKRRTVKENALISKYAKISPISRNHILLEYYRQQKRQYRAKLCEYIANNRQFLRIGIKAFLARLSSSSAQGSLLMGGVAPDFRYKPRAAVLRELVERAAEF